MTDEQKIAIARLALDAGLERLRTTLTADADAHCTGCGRRRKLIGGYCRTCEDDFAEDTDYNYCKDN